MTGNVATRGPETAPATHPALAERVREARARLDPPTVSVPAPRSEEGVVPSAVVRTDAQAPAEDLLTALDALAEELEAVEKDEDDETHRTLCRIAELVGSGVPEAGWSAAEDLDADVLPATSEAARALHGRASELVERLDAEERHGPAAVVDSVATTLRVVGVVADLEVFERARQ